MIALTEFDFDSFLSQPWSSHELVHWNLQVVIMGILVCWSCGIVGTFVVIRKMALMGDAISHGILPGLVIAYLISGSLNIGPMFIGACVAGLVCSFCIEWLHSRTSIKQDAAMAIVFTSFFALGMILLNLQTGHLDLDAGCILYGEIGLTPLSQEFQIWGQALGNEKLWVMGFVCFAVFSLVIVFYKQLLLASFDPILSQSAGLLNLGLMSLLAVVTVASLESVGVILVVAMLVFPCVTASFFFTRLPAILLATLPLGVCYTIGGLHLAFWLDCSIAGAMTISAACIFVFAGTLGPKGSVLHFIRTQAPD